MAWPRNRFVIAISLLALLATGPTQATGPPEADEIQAWIDARDYEGAVKQGQMVLAQLESKHDRRSLAVANILELIVLAMAKGSIGTTEEQLLLGARALEIKETLLKEGDPSLASAHYIVGLVHFLDNRYDLALKPFETALRFAESANGAPEEKYLREYGSALFNTGRYDQARPIFERQLATSRDDHGKGDGGTVRALFNVALISSILGEFERAERVYADALAIVDIQDPNIPLLVRVLDGYSIALYLQGRAQEAFARADRSLSLRRSHFGEESLQVAVALNNLAEMRRRLGDFELASRHLKEGIRINTNDDKEVLLAFRFRFNLAVTLRQLGDLEASQQMFDAALKAGGQLEGNDSFRGDFYREYAGLLTDLGKFDAARRAFDLGEDLLREAMGENSYDYARVLADRGRFEIDRNDTAAARNRLERALKIFESRLGPAHPLAGQTLNALARVYLTLEEPERALRAAIRATSLREEETISTLMILSEAQSMAFLKRPHEGMDVALALALSAGSPGETRRLAYDAVIRNRALAFDEMTGRGRFLADLPTDIETTTKIRELQQAKTRMANLFLIGPVAGEALYAKRLADLRADVEARETSLAGHTAASRHRKARHAFGLEQLGHALSESTAIVSYIRRVRPISRTTGYVAVILRHGQALPTFVDLGDAQPLDNGVAAWRRTLRADQVFAGDLESAESNYRKAAIELRRLIWDPIRVLLAGVQTVFVVPDGSLHLVNLAGLPVGDHYLVEENPAFHYLTAERDLAPTEGEPGSGLLAMGNPDFSRVASPAPNPTLTFRGAAPACAAYAERKFEPLPETADEIKAVRRIWKTARRGEARTLTGVEASEAAFKKAAPGVEVLHLATHGFFLGEKCELGNGLRGIGGLVPAGATQTSPPPRVGPFLLSGLALAGANRRTEIPEGGEDGVLTAEEVGALDLHGVRLAVLSACRTGAGTVREGEGVFGLRRAFLVAGVRTVVTNLWDVQDRSARLWVEAFYEQRLIHERSIPESTRAASLTILHTRRRAKQATHPFFWAGWVAAGSPN